MSGRIIAGFFGKLPCVGDFVSRRLPPAFTDAWDASASAWLSACVERHGDGWQAACLAMAPWRFALTAGVVGDEAWLGVVVPSNDKVGRVYPLVVAIAVEVMPGGWPCVPASAWFEEAESACVDAVAGQRALGAFDAAIATLRDPASVPVDAERVDRMGGHRVYFWQRGRDDGVGLDALPAAGAEAWLLGGEVVA